MCVHEYAVNMSAQCLFSGKIEKNEEKNLTRHEVNAKKKERKETNLTETDRGIERGEGNAVGAE